MSTWSAPKLIGVAADGNSSGRDAVALGSLLARATSAELLLIAVHEEPLVPVSLPGGMSWTTLQEQSHAMLVVGSAGDADAGRVRLGRNAGELLGHLECPLAIAPSGFQQQAAQRLDRIGVGFDDSPESRAAIDLAVSIASTADAMLEVRKAIDDGIAGEVRAEQIVLEQGAVTEGQPTSSFRRGPAVPPGAGLSTNVEVEVGMPSDVLSELCEQVDLLVLGSGHSAPPGRVQPGSTGRALLRLARAPVVLVPRPDAPPREQTSLGNG